MYRSQLSEAPRTSSDETHLLSLARSGSGTAFGQLAWPHARKIYLLALQMTGNAYDAEDVVQQTLTKALEHLEDFEGKSSFATWLARIATNDCRTRLRTRKARPAVSLDEPVAGGEEMLPREIADGRADPEQCFLTREKGDLLWAAIDMLPTPYRGAFMLCEIDGRSIEAAAAALGLTAEAVRNRLVRARIWLREKLLPCSRNCNRCELSCFLRPCERGRAMAASC